jgi:glucokinase
MNGTQIIGIDLGGTQVRAGIVADGKIVQIVSSLIPSSGSVEEVLAVVFRETDRLFSSSVTAIGIGVPSVVDVEKGIVYNVQNIPSWKEVALKSLMESRYHVPVIVNNDANCFALGEKHFGKGKEAHSLIGLIIGTGLGAGIIINDQLYAGAHCGAGEFGEIDYREHNYEYYASGSFFKNRYNTGGNDLFQQAENGNERALAAFEEYGRHLGDAIKMILFAYDPELVILGGSVRYAYTHFRKTMWERIHTFTYPESLKHFSVEVSGLENSGVLGAAALYLNEMILK